MDVVVKNSSRRGAEDEGEEEAQQNPFVSNIIAGASTPKLQFRKEASTAKWDDELGMGEVVEKKGSMWATTGIVRDGKLYCHIEETLFLVERGALLLLGSDGSVFNIKDIYKKIAQAKDGYTWESFQAYRHLKLLGYIVGRHGVPWTMKSSKSLCNSISPQSTCDNDKGSNIEVEDMMAVTQLLKDMQFNEVKPTFDVYQPNSKFRKSSPGDPTFLLRLLRENPPSGNEVQFLEKNCNSISLKYCFVDHGRVSFFSFEKVMIPVLP